MGGGTVRKLAGLPADGLYHCWMRVSDGRDREAGVHIEVGAPVGVVNVASFGPIPNERWVLDESAQAASLEAAATLSDVA
jgi:hypothetical protein